ncbi:hypothetical protein [Paenibacillus motobuensis]|uniref:hypothetical protein n=1 Tax=Paenibacillus motobuensis TaxID=295324 RepID=UPI0031DC4C57
MILSRVHHMVRSRKGLSPKSIVRLGDNPFFASKAGTKRGHPRVTPDHPDIFDRLVRLIGAISPMSAMGVMGAISR